MILRLLLLLLLPVMAYYFVRSISQRFALTSRQNTFLFFLVASLLVVGVMIAIGRLPFQFILAPIGVAATFLLRMLPTLLRLLPMWHLFKGRAAAAKPPNRDQVSTIRTEFFDMELQHDDGSMDGVVLRGNFSKRRLSTLQLPDLLELYQECRKDADSSQVLEAYIDRVFPDWREHAQAQHEGAAAVAHESLMTETLALEILGLDETADKEQVTKAHRGLMQKMHPDRGGSDYLAQKINAAKDFLMQKL
ncbi:MAG: molecular chaperone DnaJ [SAR86 cluster bacterium]|uniref:Molecular chaperone DnaJ n=1 Tax=SAR86 cluster bacterium TaxID=2030880 RepID=A0A2A4XFG1_9GAMM|nr:MAG: molecular chaperone DnaJ [SAR86 cluster bacterium]